MSYSRSALWLNPHLAGAAEATKLTLGDTLRIPVLYMPDGGIGEDFLHIAGLVQISSLNGTMRPHLLVGIENTERRAWAGRRPFARSFAMN